MKCNKKFAHNKQIKNIKSLIKTCELIFKNPQDYKDFDFDFLYPVYNQLKKALNCNCCYGQVKTKINDSNDHHNHYVCLIPACKTIICYPCSSQKSEQYRIKTSMILETIDLQENDVFFITPTMPNVKYKEFTNEKVGELNRELWKRFLSYLKKYAKKLGGFKLKDYIKKVEDTFNLSDKSFNHHFHLLVVAPKKVLNYKVFRDIWTQAYNSYFGTNHKSLSIEFQLIKNPNELKMEISKYINKDLIFNVDINDYKKDLLKQVKELRKELEMAKEKGWKEKKIKAIEKNIEGKEKDIKWCNTHTQDEFNLWWLWLLCALYRKQKIQFNGIFKPVKEPLKIKELWESGYIHKVNKVDDLMEQILETSDPYTFLAHWIFEAAKHYGVGELSMKVENSSNPKMYFGAVYTMIKLINECLDESIDLRVLNQVILDEQPKDEPIVCEAINWYWNKYLSIL